MTRLRRLSPALLRRFRSAVAAGGGRLLGDGLLVRDELPDRPVGQAHRRLAGLHLRGAGGIDLAEHSEAGYDLSPVYYSSRVGHTLVLTKDDFPGDQQDGSLEVKLVTAIIQPEMLNRPRRPSSGTASAA